MILHLRTENMKVTAIIEKSTDGQYYIYVKDDLPGFGLTGIGETVDLAKEDLLIAYREMGELFAEQGKEIVELEFEYK